MGKTALKPTDSELEILRELWNIGQATVREINDRINKKRETGYTTTLKLMQIMYAKKLIDREENGRNHVYKAIIKESDIQKELVDKLLETAFGGSAKKLVMHALGNSKTNKEELEEIKELLKKLEHKNGMD